MREEAFAKTMRHPLESKFVHEGRQARLLLAVAGGMAAGIGVSVIAALVPSGLKTLGARPLPPDTRARRPRRRRACRSTSTALESVAPASSPVRGLAARTSVL